MAMLLTAREGLAVRRSHDSRVGQTYTSTRKLIDHCNDAMPALFFHNLPVHLLHISLVIVGLRGVNVLQATD